MNHLLFIAVANASREPVICQMVMVQTLHKPSADMINAVAAQSKEQRDLADVHECKHCMNLLTRLTGNSAEQGEQRSGRCS
jgi:hypothetical protein